MNYALLLVSASLLVFLLTGILRKYALSRSLLDIPNERSSHSVPTPRGGGVSIVLVFILSLPYLMISDVLPVDIVIAYVGTGAGVALIGFLDDHGHIAARWRLLAHLLAAAWALFWIGGMPPVLVLGHTIDLYWIGQVLALLYLVWMLNLYNFMDGINGLASIEAITVSLGGSLLLYLYGDIQNLWLLPIILVATVSGFIFWNFPVAKIFMGDACSGFLGIILGMFTIQIAWEYPFMLWSWFILLGVFIVDATITLLSRIIKGEKFYEAHCSHAYQIASRKYNSHITVSIAVGVINVLWLLPIANFVRLDWLNGILGVLIAYLPLIWLVIYFRAKENI